ncbi:hypothetical protein BDA96_09G143800 [Sorghum bicolor]|uniref:Secreted protein n=1 Tax=Sorghum bicolor TaxID=4558 RepID=A0A921U461_SORBI|nr:hypothetical protein BDA96_09G143600 [Sorghum bicolor]KAG0518069.1 hypothetical protein BDA96_09G143800 [Sorghum bicolor]
MSMRPWLLRRTFLAPIIAGSLLAPIAVDELPQPNKHAPARAQGPMLKPCSGPAPALYLPRPNVVHPRPELRPCAFTSATPTAPTPSSVNLACSVVPPLLPPPPLLWARGNPMAVCRARMRPTATLGRSGCPRTPEPEEEERPLIFFHFTP